MVIVNELWWSIGLWLEMGKERERENEWVSERTRKRGEKME